MIDRTSTLDQSHVRSNFHFVKFDWSNSITIDQTNTLGLIGCSIGQSNTLGSIRSSIDPMILSWSIEQSHVRSNFHYVKFNWSNSITINQTNALGFMGCLIDQSNTLGLIRSSIDPMILSWSIGLVLRINPTLDRTFIVSSLIDQTLTRSLILMH
jgi:hypothetical protein